MEDFSQPEERRAIKVVNLMNTSKKSENLANWTIDHFNAHVVLNSFSIYVLKLFDSTEQRSQ